MAVCFLSQIKHTSDAYTKGIVVKEEDTAEAAINSAKQSFHAYLGAYGYGNDANTDYVACMVFLDDGRVIMNEVDDRRPTEEEPEEE